MLGSGQLGPYGGKDMLFKGGVAEVFQNVRSWLKVVN